MIDRSVGFFRQRQVLHQRRRRSLLQQLGQSCSGCGQLRLPTAGQENARLRTRYRRQLFGCAGQHCATVPPQAGVQRDVAVEQRWLLQQRLDHEQAGQRFTDQRAFVGSRVALAHLRHQLFAQERAVGRRTTNARRDLPVLRVVAGAGHVAAALGVLDANQQERTHAAVAAQHLHQPGHMQEVLTDAAIGHVHHRQRRLRIQAPRLRAVNIDAAGFAQRLRPDGEGLADGQRRGGSGRRGFCSHQRRGGDSGQQQRQHDQTHGAVHIGKALSIDRRRHCRSRHFADRPELEHHGVGDGHATRTMAHGLVTATLISTRRFPC